MNNKKVSHGKMEMGEYSKAMGVHGMTFKKKVTSSDLGIKRSA